MMGLTPPLEGGSERHIFEISSRLKECEVFTQKGSICKNSIGVWLPEKPALIRNVFFLVRAFFYSLYLLLKIRKEYEIIHIHENLLYFLATLLRMRYKVIITVHGIEGFKFYDNKFLWLFFRQGLRFANYLIAVNKEDKKRLEKFFDKKKIVYFPNGVNTSIYKSVNAKVQKKISFIGRVHEQKGIIYLLRAFKEISKKFSDYKLEIMGEVNDYAKELQKEFKGLKIEWRGYMKDRKEIAKSLKSATCITLPSLWEGLPLTLFESLASGRPIIVSDIPAFNSVLKDEAYFCKVKDSNSLAKKIEEVIKNKKKADLIGKKGLKLSEQYDWENIAMQMGKFYRGEYDAGKSYF